MTRAVPGLQNNRSVEPLYTNHPPETADCQIPLHRETGGAQNQTAQGTIPAGDMASAIMPMQTALNEQTQEQEGGAASSPWMASFYPLPVSAGVWPLTSGMMPTNRGRSHQHHILQGDSHGRHWEEDEIIHVAVDRQDSHTTPGHRGHSSEGYE